MNKANNRQFKFPNKSLIDFISCALLSISRRYGNDVEVVLSPVFTKYSDNFPHIQSNTQQSFISSVFHDENKRYCFSLPGFGNVKISHLRKNHTHLLQQALDMKINGLS